MLHFEYYQGFSKDSDHPVSSVCPKLSGLSRLHDPFQPPDRSRADQALVDENRAMSSIRKRRW